MNATGDSEGSPHQLVISGESLRVLERIRYELLLLSSERKVYEQLFMGSEGATQVLMETAAELFKLIHYSLLDTMTLRICKLTEPAKNRRFDNLSFNSLLQGLKDELPSEAKTACKLLLKELRPIADGLRKHRHKRIAHLDLRHGLGLETLEPGSGSYERIESATKLLNRLMNTVENLLPDGPMLYEQIIMLGTDGDALIRKLLMAKYYADEENAGRLSKICRMLAQRRQTGESSQT